MSRHDEPSEKNTVYTFIPPLRFIDENGEGGSEDA